MNKHKQFIVGILCGVLLTGVVGVFALEIVENSIPVKVNGEIVDIRGYNIDGNTYFKLRDLGQSVGFSVDFQDNTVIVESSAVPTASPVPSTPLASGISFTSDPTVPDGDVAGKTDDGLDVVFYDGVPYVTKGGIELKLASLGHKNYTFRTDYIGDDDSSTGEPVLSNIPLCSQDKQCVPFDFYLSDILPWILTLD